MQASCTIHGRSKITRETAATTNQMAPDKHVKHAASKVQLTWAYVTLCWAVQVTKKTTQERMPSLDRYSDRSKADDASHSVVYDRAYRRGEGEEEDIPPENLAKAFKVRPGFRV